MILPGEMFYDNKGFQEPQAISNVFNTFFYSNFKFDKFVQADFSKFRNDNLYRIYITEEEVLNVLCKLNINKAYRCDGLLSLKIVQKF